MKLIDKLAIALTDLLAEADTYASLMPRCEPGSPSGKAQEALGEYHAALVQRAIAKEKQQQRRSNETNTKNHLQS